MAKEILFVQFTHPGKEYALSPSEKANGFKEWNYGPHRRKYIKTKGQIVMANGLSPKQYLKFWGEWEPTSKVTKVSNTKGSNDLPKWIHTPFIEISSNHVFKVWQSFKKVIKNHCNLCSSTNKAIPQNTDPFVFDDSFYYSCCKQNHFTRLKNLEIGTIILFGSKKTDNTGNPYFALDTVFVISDYREYNDKNFNSILKGFTPTYYDQIMGFRFWLPPFNYICYKGANYHNQINGMFSFVPCKTDEKTSTGFSRVNLTQKDLAWIHNNLSRSLKYKNSSINNNKIIWDSLCRIIHKQGFELGVNFEYQIIP